MSAPTNPPILFRLSTIPEPQQGSVSCATEGRPFSLQCCMYAKKSSPSAPMFPCKQPPCKTKLVSMLFGNGEEYLSGSSSRRI